jgi:prophage regulatory protein
MSIILRMRDVVNATGLSRSTIYHMIKTNEFPRPIRLGQRAVGWLQSDITSWLDQRPKGGSWPKVSKDGAKELGLEANNDRL